MVLELIGMAVPCAGLGLLAWVSFNLGATYFKDVRKFDKGLPR